MDNKTTQQETILLTVDYIFKNGDLGSEDPFVRQTTAGWRVVVNKKDYGSYIILTEPNMINETTKPEVLRVLRIGAMEGAGVGMMQHYVNDKYIFEEAWIRIKNKFSKLFTWI